jgi:hypothetical protein
LLASPIGVVMHPRPCPTHPLGTGGHCSSLLPGATPRCAARRNRPCWKPLQHTARQWRMRHRMPQQRQRQQQQQQPARLSATAWGSSCGPGLMK